jgi:hypothetical protein
VSQGHGIVHGRGVASKYVAEQRRLLDALRGAAAPLSRPPGERNWMIADSLCRQRLWGAWTGGDYRDGDPMPSFDPAVDQPAIAMYAACTPAPNGIAVLED